MKKLPREWQIAVLFCARDRALLLVVVEVFSVRPSTHGNVKNNLDGRRLLPRVHISSAGTTVSPKWRVAQHPTDQTWRHAERLQPP